MVQLGYMWCHHPNATDMDFNSSMVQLGWRAADNAEVSEVNFNSSMVQLGWVIDPKRG